MYVLTVLLLSSTSLAIAQTQVPDTIPGGIWTKAGSPYILDRTTVLTGNLTIEPGVAVLGTHDRQSVLFSVFGAIRAIGTSVDSIIFEKVRVVSFHTDKFSDVRDNWYFRYCVFKNDYRALTFDAYSVQMDTVVNCSFYGNETGLWVGGYSNPTLYVKNCMFTNNSLIGISCWTHTAPCILDGCAFDGNVEGIRAMGRNIIVRNCLIVNNVNYGLHINPNGDGTPIIGGSPEQCNKIYGNGINVRDSYSTVDSIDVSYNYWGLVNEDSIAQTIQGLVRFKPFVDENCMPVVGIDVPPSPQSLQVEVYPNPVATGAQAQLVGYTHGTVEYEVYDALGSSLWFKHAESATVVLPEFPPGMYFLFLRCQERTGVARIIVN